MNNDFKNYDDDEDVLEIQKIMNEDRKRDRDINELNKKMDEVLRGLGL